MPINIKHEVSGGTYGTAAKEVGAAKTAKEYRDREYAKNAQKELAQFNANLQAKQSQQNFQNQMALREISNKQDVVKAAQLKDIELEAKAREIEQTTQLRKELMGQVDPYGQIKVSEALATQEPQYDYSSSPKLQKQANTINQGIQTLNSYLSAGLFDNRMDEYKMLYTQLQNQLNTVNSMAKPIKTIADEFKSSTLSTVNPIDGTTQIIQKKKNGEFTPLFKASKLSQVSDGSKPFDLLSIEDKSRMVQNAIKANQMLTGASYQEQVEAGKKYYNALTGTATMIDEVQPEKMEIAIQLQNIIGQQFDATDIAAINSKSLEDLQALLKKKIQAQIALSINQ